MDALPAPDDSRFRDAFESGSVLPADFRHRDHLRLAFVYLCESGPSGAYGRMRDAIQGFLVHHGLPAQKYHETLTQSWLQAVRHFLERAGRVRSFEQFLSVDDRLLDADIMLTHYSRPHLFSERARQQFVEPDLEPIPRYG